MRHYYYIAGNDEPIRVKAKRKPGLKTRPRSDTWCVEEFDGKHWANPPFGEVTWGTLKKLKYIGSVEILRGISGE